LKDLMRGGHLMKTIIIVCIIFIFFGVPGFQLQLAFPYDWSPEEQNIWKLEQIYMKNYKEKNLDILSQFWHQEFIGWPEWSGKPVNVAEAKAALKKPSETKIISFKIQPQKIVMHDNITITYYSIDLKVENEKKELKTVSVRIIHTWLKKNGKWRIIGGMSSK